MSNQSNHATDELAAALRSDARDAHERAALDIVLGLPGQPLTRPDLRAAYIHEDEGEPVGVRWVWLHDDLRILPAQVPVSTSERRLLMIACSIAEPANPVSLNEVLAGLDRHSVQLVTDAIQRIGGAQ